METLRQDWSDWRRWLWLVGIFTLIGLTFALQEIIPHFWCIATNCESHIPKEWSVWLSAGYVLLTVYAMMLLVPLVWTLEKRLHLRNLGWKRWLIMHGTMSLGFILLHTEVDWIEAKGNYVQIHAGPEVYRLREKLSMLEQRLDQRNFARIHRSMIVNLNRVKELQPWFHGEYHVHLNDGTKLTLSRRYKAKVEAQLGSRL
ncbi:LytTR family transcriptional regulator [Candidatus Acetothermia bacterium]|nr:LytTR family transcriptional regulator [Candidatus Acetothermia bacterium]MBI3459424.1 LytTR family transcriptional regulator [Candidatus Acetothermia bacterium]MBI3660555.1 LytTR family transcriptional regulator [Candidatus Acetothermia bacterium]